MRRLLLFFALGALLFAAKRVWPTEGERPQLVVTVPRSAAPADVERAIDRAVLTNLALSTDAVAVDPVVRDQLLRAMRSTADEHGDGAELIARALALGVHRVDPVVQERLAFQGEQLLRARLPPERPDDAELEAYRAAHAARYAVPARVSFQQVFLSRTRRGERLASDAEHLRALLFAPGAEGRVHSDPTLQPLSFEEVDARELDARFGAGFGEAAFEAELGVWSGPVASAYGLHFLRVRARAPAEHPPLERVRERVLEDYAHDRLRERMRRALLAERAQFRIDVQRRGS